MLCPVHMYFPKYCTFYRFWLGCMVAVWILVTHFLSCALVVVPYRDVFLALLIALYLSSFWVSVLFLGWFPLLVLSLRRPHILHILHYGVVLALLLFARPVAVLSCVLCVVGCVWVCAGCASYFLFQGLAFLGFRFIFGRVVRMPCGRLSL